MASVHCLYMSYPRNSCDMTRIRSLFVINTLHPAGGLYNDISSPAPSHICFSTSSMHTRKSCLCWPFRYSICAVSNPPDNTGLLPICVAEKPKHQKWAQNVFVDDCGYPDKTEHYKALLRNVEGVILQKLKHPAPPLDKVDPLFFCTYDKAKQGKQMRRDLNLSHLKPQVRNHVYVLVKKYWPVFDKNGVQRPTLPWQQSSFTLPLGQGIFRG
jgi:hypothetical protein